MIPYFSFFACSLLILYFSCKFKSAIVQWIIILIALSLPAVLAGWRDFSIGTDTETYIGYWRLTCYEHSFRNYWLFYSDGALEELYLLFSYMVSKFTNSDQLFLFSVQLLILLPIVVTSRRLNINMIWSIFIYLAILFNISINAARQVIAISFCLLSFSYVIQGEYKISIFWIIVAYGFHHSAILFGGILGLNLLISRFCNFMSLKVVQLLFCVSIALIFTIFASWGATLVENFMGGAYEGYSDSTQFGTKFPIALFGLAFFDLIIYSFMRKSISTSDSHILCLFDYLIYISVPLCLSGLVSTFLVRIVYYPLFLVILIFPFIIKYYKLSCYVRISLLFAYISYFILTSVPYKFIY